VDVELVLEPQRPLVVEGRRDAGPPVGRIGREDAHAVGAPQRVLRLLQVAEEGAEMHDAGGIRLVELDPAAEDERVRHEDDASRANGVGVR